MCGLLADPKVKQCYSKDDHEEDQRSRSRYTVVLECDLVLNMTDYRIHITLGKACTAGNRSVISKHTDNAGIFLEATDEAGDYGVGDHGREKRHRNTAY